MSPRPANIRIASCACGQAALEAAGEPILSAVCYCQSCRAAARVLEALPAAPAMVGSDGGTEFVLHRKDRVRCLRGGEHLREHRLTASSTTRRVVAACCNSAMFLEFTRGHWLSLYAHRLPEAGRPAPEMRVMTADLGRDARFPDTLPGYRTHSVRFMARLLLAWAAMGFRAPRVDFVKGRIDDPPAEKIEIENIASSGHVYRVDRVRYEAMRTALLAVLPASAPGLTVAQAKEALLPLLPQDLFPGGAKAGWWLKAAQLDLEAKGVIAREATKPLRLHKAR